MSSIFIYGHNAVIVAVLDEIFYSSANVAIGATSKKHLHIGLHYGKAELREQACFRFTALGKVGHDIEHYLRQWNTEEVIRREQESRGFTFAKIEEPRSVNFTPKNVPCGRLKIAL